MVMTIIVAMAVMTMIGKNHFWGVESFSESYYGLHGVPIRAS